MKNADSANIRAVVQLAFSVGKAHKPPHKSALSEFAVVERNNTCRGRAKHVVKVYSDRNTLELSDFFHCFVNIGFQFLKAAFEGNILYQIAKGTHALGFDIKIGKNIAHQRDAANVFVHFSQAVYQRPERRALLILLKTLQITQIRKLFNKILHGFSQLGKTEKILKNVAPVTDDLGIIGDAYHQLANVIPFVSLFCQCLQDKIYG